MKSLRVRLSLAFVLVAWLPMAVVGVLAQRGIEARTRESYARQLDARAEAGRRLLAGRASDMSATLARLCAHDLLVDRVMLDLARGHFMGPEQAELERLLPPLMESVGFDALLLFDARGADRGRVLGAGHYPSLAGARDVALLQELERSGDEPFVTTLRVRDGREPARDEQAWVTGCAVERDGVRVALLGGAFLDAERASRWFGEDSAVRAVLVRPGDALPSEVRDGGGQASVFTFRSASGEERYELLAAIDDADLEAQLAGLLQQNLLTAGVAALLALLFATLVAVRLSRPLRELEDAATRIGAGDLELAIDERGGGEVGRTFSAFNHMTRELKSAQKRLRRAERIAAWRDIARRIAHEIKNPLSPIQVSIETMRKTYAKKHPDFDEIFEESTLTILEEVERMKRIVGEFSEFARMPRPRLDSVDLVRVAEQVTTLHAHDDVPPELRVEGAIPMVRADREQVAQVLVNLVQNARDAALARHGMRGGVVRVVLRADREGVLVSVLDNGPGIPLDQRDTVFEPYYTTKSTGTGLGLAIVQRIVEDHGGLIELGEGLDGGAGFRVFFPVSGPPMDASESQADATLSELTRS
ncbi:MAG: HAMP domain-containing protein [Sandaracinaceae bacterium]|jgi:two-component system nitrogen regulation sensor histidine kinase NtrY|nr:HAMP domain-containing protein [Sandaracinaceae bacterium]MBK7151027.1 HAMP domain-containing protein [Sandaracinaceae bacterium]MBK7773146.1 HAMP domain-containing protein [Sandaracinaceae bacterium]MBK8407355.1 HAMP domain-containing protein [Sandaracinaceae bacterium]